MASELFDHASSASLPDCSQPGNEKGTGVQTRFEAAIAEQLWDATEDAGFYAWCDWGEFLAGVCDDELLEVIQGS